MVTLVQTFYRLSVTMVMLVQTFYRLSVTMVMLVQTFYRLSVTLVTLVQHLKHSIILITIRSPLDISEYRELPWLSSVPHQVSSPNMAQ